VLFVGTLYFALQCLNELRRFGCARRTLELSGISWTDELSAQNL
jgi:hypothetical protein